MYICIYMYVLQSLELKVKGCAPVRRARSAGACTLHPAPCTLHPAPCTLNPEPSTLNPQPSTLTPNLQP